MASQTLLLLVLCFSNGFGEEIINPYLVKYWANEIGDELWRLGRNVTQADKIQAMYEELKIPVKKKNGYDLVEEITGNVGSMLDMKMQAVKCIMEVAESVAEQHEYLEEFDFFYRNAKESKVVEFEEEREENETSRFESIVLERNKYFYNIPINLNYSSVHVPTNVWDRGYTVMNAIEWSKQLDEVFKTNYKIDPTLSWQYFGSSSGFMRQYPAIHWNQEINLFDCRNRLWYIEAATCTKDMVILFDNSGSMTGRRHEIAKLVAEKILDTLDNNDFVNIFEFSNVSDAIIPCFRDRLVQATPQNIIELKRALDHISPEGLANFSYVFEKSFEILQEYRYSETLGSKCNQVIMLITDGLPGNVTDVFEKYNWNETDFLPVRVFTFLLGKEVTNVEEIMWMACYNRGYYAHLQSLDEVVDGVLKYIPVLARPMVLQKTDHPVFWTHAYADITDPKLSNWLSEVMQHEDQKERYKSHMKGKKLYFSQQLEDEKYVFRLKSDIPETGHKLQEYRILAAVSMPVFDRREWEDNDTRIANLLGVAGTDIPVDSILKLTSPHKLGANGYAFIVTNNGYLLIHPDLRPVFEGTLKPNFNSVDLTEVELVDDDREPRDIDPALVKLREDMVNQYGGANTLDVKYHYDDMRRGFTGTRHYFFRPLINTPYTLGIALPEDYGLYTLAVTEDDDLSTENGVPITDFFKGANWKIHPDWTYCKYMHDNGLDFDSSEEELLHFLERIHEEDWEWISPSYQATDFLSCESRNETEIDLAAHICDKELLQFLIWDAEITDSFFTNESDSSESESSESEEEDELQHIFNVTLKFVATHSGLTRWLDMLKGERNFSKPHFSEFRTKAIDEYWYKHAVHYHTLDPESFVFTVPFDESPAREDDFVVTASYAIHHHEAAAAVVGFQFPQSALYYRVMNITSERDVNCNDTTGNCNLTCDASHLDCFILDSNGYIIVSEYGGDVGRFFGEIQGGIMSMLVEQNIYKKIEIFDYQAMCSEEELSSGAPGFLTPFYHLQLLIEWIFGQVVWTFAQINLHQLWYTDWVKATEEVYYDLEDEMSGGSEETDEEEGEEGEEIIDPEEEAVNMTEPEHCDKRINLFSLNPASLNLSVAESISPNCSVPFIVQKIPHSNLLLLVVENLCTDPGEEVSVEPKEIKYDNFTTLACYKINNDLPRKRHATCLTSHPDEAEITLCGGCQQLGVPSILISIAITILLFVTNSNQ